MNLEQLRADCARKQKKGIHFILASVIIWTLVLIVQLTGLPVMTKNLLTFCCAAPLLPLSFLAGKIIKVDIFSNSNPLGKLGLLFTLNQLLYLLIVMWVYSAVPDKMLMVYAMVFGAHLFPYSWLYKSRTYMVFAIAIPFAALILGLYFNGLVIAVTLTLAELVFVVLLFRELKKTGN